MNKITSFLPLFFLILFTACASDKESFEEKPEIESNTLHINLLLSSSGSTRALETEGTGTDGHPDDPLITDALVLLFLPGEDGTLSQDSRLAYLIKAENPVEIDESKYSLDFKFEIDPETISPSLVAVILANGCDRYDTVNALDDPTYQDICEAVTTGISEREALFAGHLTGEYFSFWGIATRTIDTSLLTQTLKVAMIRDLAKTTVVLDSDLIATTGHALTGVTVYNRFDTISLLPEVGDDNTPVLPSIPANSSKTADPGIDGAAEDGVSASILHPEQDILMGSTTGEVSDDNKFNRPALIVGVDWKGTGKVYYYRIDYKENGLLIDVKRNHHYLVNVKDIKGPGADTPEKAYHTFSATVEATVTPWTDMENDVEIDGENWIAMTRTVFLDSKAGSTAALNFLTNVETDLWEMAWGNADATPEDLQFSDSDVVVSEDGTFSVKKGETLAFEALTDLPANLESREVQLYINVTPRLRLVINVVQSAASSSGDMPNWNDQSIFDEI